MSATHSTITIQTEETWKDIPGIPFYQASSFGRIRSLTRVIQSQGRWGPVEREFLGQVLVACENSHGYLSVSVGRPPTTATVHSLVALAFHGERPEGLEINHKDGNKLNCRPDNLEYVTSTENNHHALNTGLRKAKITDVEIKEMKALGGHVSHREIGRRFGIHHKTVANLISGGRKTRPSNS